MWGATRTLDKRKGPGRTASPTEVTGRAEPFPTTIEDGREGWGIGGRQSTCVRGGVVGGTGVSHPVRDGGGWGQRHCGEGVGKRLRVPPIGPGSPHGWSRRPWEGKEPLLRLGRCRGHRRRRSGKENLLRGSGARGRGARGWPGPHLDGASPRVVEGWPLGATRGMTPAAAATLATTTATATATPLGARRLPKRSRRREAGVRRRGSPRRQRGEPEERCRAPWRERRSQWWRGEAPQEVDHPWPQQRWEKASCG
jgi:hypothetical protein